MKIIKLTLLVLSIFVFNSFISTNVYGQKKADDPTVKTINTYSAVYYIVYEGDQGDGTVELQIHDRKHQYVSMDQDRLEDQAKGIDPKNPLLKFINIPEIDPLAFRQVETLEEAKLPVDGITVIQFKYNKLREAHRVVYK
jgi:hypothetical protein